MPMTVLRMPVSVTCHIMIPRRRHRGIPRLHGRRNRRDHARARRTRLRRGRRTVVPMPMLRMPVTIVHGIIGPWRRSHHLHQFRGDRCAARYLRSGRRAVLLDEHHDGTHQRHRQTRLQDGPPTPATRRRLRRLRLANGRRDRAATMLVLATTAAGTGLIATGNGGRGSGHGGDKTLSDEPVKSSRRFAAIKHPVQLPRSA